jgi:hypothetical protein
LGHERGLCDRNARLAKERLAQTAFEQADRKGNQARRDDPRPTPQDCAMSLGRVRSESDERTVNNTMCHQYRVLSDEEKENMIAIKDFGLGFIEVIDRCAPKGREASLAKTKIEEAVMWAVKGLTA